MISLGDLQHLVGTREHIGRRIHAVDVRDFRLARDDLATRALLNLHLWPRHGQHREALRTDGEEMPPLIVLQQEFLRIIVPAIVFDFVPQQAGTHKNHRGMPPLREPNGIMRKLKRSARRRKSSTASSRPA